MLIIILQPLMAVCSELINFYSVRIASRFVYDCSGFRRTTLRLYSRARINFLPVISAFISFQRTFLVFLGTIAVCTILLCARACMQRK